MGNKIKKSCKNCGWNNAWKDGGSGPFYHANMCDSKKLKMWSRKIGDDVLTPDPDDRKVELHPRDPRHPDFLSIYLGEPFESKNMTNQEAADILKDIVNNMIYPIGSGKTGMMLRRYEAYTKAIELLENTPD